LHEINNIFQRLTVFILYVLCLFTVSIGDNAAAKSVLKIAAIGHSGDIRQGFYSIGYEFERLNPEVEVQFIIKPDAVFKQQLPQMLAKEGAIDIVIWHSGERLNYYVKRSLVTPITDIWHEHQLEQQFSGITENMVSYNEQIYALPISYYQWGFYYRKSLFHRLGITPPKTWPEFLDILATIEQTGIIPIYIGTKNPWPAGCWFEYLNLRINGLKYHNAFVRGEIRSDDSGIKHVLSYWKTLIDKGYFFEDHQTKDLAEGFPLIYREKAGITLAGHFVESYMSDAVKREVGFFSFPEINAQVDEVQVTPLDIMFIAQLSSLQTIAKKFIVFAASEEAQSMLNDKLNQFPANKHSSIIGNGLLQEVKLATSGAKGLTHFYDRAVEKIYGQENLLIWNHFLANADISYTIEQMEQVRLKYLVRVEDARQLNEKMKRNIK